MILINLREVDIFFFFFYFDEQVNTQEDLNLLEQQPLNNDQGYVFISYSQKDKDFAYKLRNILTQNAIPSWMAPESIPTGSDYTEEIPIAIRECSCMVFLLSNHSQNSEWVLREVERAIHYKKTVLVVALEQVELNPKFEYLISICQRVSLKDFSTNCEGTKALIQRIRTLLKEKSKENN